MKKFFALVTVTLVTATASATSIQLPLVEYTRSPLHGMGRETVAVRIIDNGAVYGYLSRDGRQAEWKHLDTISKYQMNRLRGLVLRAKKNPALVAPLGSEVTCAAVPMHQDVYRSPLHNLTLEQAQSPCGGVQFNDTRSSAEIVEALNGYRNKLYGQPIR